MCTRAAQTSRWRFLSARTSPHGAGAALVPRPGQHPESDHELGGRPEFLRLPLWTTFPNQGENTWTSERSSTVAHPRDSKPHAGRSPRTRVTAFQTVSLKLHSIECVRSTKEIDADEIAIVGLATSVVQTNGRAGSKTRPGKELSLGKFKKGEVRRFDQAKTIGTFGFGGGDPAAWPRGSTTDPAPHREGRGTGRRDRGTLRRRDRREGRLEPEDGGDDGGRRARCGRRGGAPLDPSSRSSARQSALRSARASWPLRP